MRVQVQDHVAMWSKIFGRPISIVDGHSSHKFRIQLLILIVS